MAIRNAAAGLNSPLAESILWGREQNGPPEGDGRPSGEEKEGSLSESDDGGIMEVGPAPSDRGITVIVPAFNEEAGITETLRGLQAAMEASGRPYEILVVDDGSTDGTAEAARGLGGIRLLSNRRNLGYGAALKRGIEAAKHPLIAITDADGTYPGERIPDLADRLDDDIEMVVGWRKGFEAKIPLIRRPAKWVLRRFAESMATHPIPDLNSGLRVFRREHALRYRQVLPDGFSFTTTITLLVLNDGGEILYEPVAYHRRAGKSKFHPIKDVINMAGLIVRSILLFYPLRVFVPISMACLALAVFVLIGSLLWLDRIPDATIVILLAMSLQFLFLGLLADLINRRSSQ